jgi:hypothetical protein
MNAEEIIKDVECKKGERGVWENHWQELTDYIMPNKNNVTRVGTPGEKKGVELFDSTAIQSNSLLASALHGMLTNPALTFFEYTTGDPDLDEIDEVRIWLDRAAQRTHMRLNNSNYQTEIHEYYLDIGCVGTGGLFIAEDKNNLFRFSARHVSELYVEESNLGVIDKVHRVFQWNARQIMQEFGSTPGFKAPDIVQKAYDKNDPKKFEIIHSIYPREDEERSKYAGGSKSWKWASCYTLTEAKVILSESGYREHPLPVGRWSKVSNETYGRSPGMAALPDIKMLNKMKETTIRGAQKTVDPPLMVPSDGFVLPLKTHPSGVNYYTSGTSDRIETFANDARIDFGFQSVDMVARQVRQAFLIDQLQLREGPQMTATEVNAHLDEMMRLMGPVLGRQHNESLRPTISRCFEIQLRNKDFPPIPQALSGRKLDVRYSSMIARVHRQKEAENILRALQTISPFIQLDPSAADNFDIDKSVRFVSKTYGFPADLIRTEKSRKTIRDARDQANQAAIQQQQESHEAEVTSKTGPVVLKAQEQAKPQ